MLDTELAIEKNKYKKSLLLKKQKKQRLLITDIIINKNPLLENLNYFFKNKTL